MKTTNTTTPKNVTNVRLFVLLLIASTGVFGQNKVEVVTEVKTEVSISQDATIVISTENTIASTSMDFAVWFTGVKTTKSDVKSNGSFNKKQLINSGVNTNSVLIRSILKKVSCQGNAVA
ncbi:hypothetical protein WFZ85_11555 [Flavobacterium sp. j3]|uniref:Uncharacterized protein n=1 Tax=Flavobacterium aureirubrum TaxID=3133147 RepID=A0ABU9N6D3_9FLAO